MVERGRLGRAARRARRTHSGEREGAGRDTAALVLYVLAAQLGRRPGQVPLVAARDWLAAPDLGERLARALAGVHHPPAVLLLAAGVDLDAGAAYGLGLVVTALADHSPATVIEDLWPAGTLPTHGGSPTW